MRRPLACFVLALPLLAHGGAPALAAPPPSLLDYSERGYVVLDPARASTRPNDERLILGVFECLTRLDAVTGAVAPAAAERWEASADGRTWTFHLRADGAWTDGTPVKAEDFVRGWRRVVDPEPDDAGVSPWRWLFRPLKGVAGMLDNDFGRRTLSNFEKRLTQELARNKEGIKGPALRSAVQEVGLKAVPGVPEQPVLRKMLRWGDDTFAPDKAQEVIEVVKAERRKRKAPTFEAWEAFGVKSGVLAKDERTLVVETEGWVPYLPALVARAAFAPIHAALVDQRAVGEDPDLFVGNGPFRLHKRGSKPVGERAPPSTVHLVRSPTYKGPSPAQIDAIRCWTDEDTPEELRRFKAGETQWVGTPDPEVKKDLPAIPGWRTRPSGTVVFLRFRCDSPPFEKPEARRAFALSIDRSVLLKRYWPGCEAAERLVPPGVQGTAPGVRVPASDVAAAKKAFAATGWTAEKFPSVDLHYTDGLDDVAASLGATWEKVLGITPGAWINGPLEAQQRLRNGAFDVFLSETHGAVDDPGAFLEVFDSTSPDGGLGWRDAALDAFLAAARDVDGAAAAPDKVLAVAKNPATKARLEAVKGSPSASTRNAARQALLAEAEQRLLDEAVVYPLLYPKTCDLVGAVKGLGADAAWANCAFVGSLRDATR